jgi:hypothetical protein
LSDLNYAYSKKGSNIFLSKVTLPSWQAISSTTAAKWDDIFSESGFPFYSMALLRIFYQSLISYYRFILPKALK